MRTEIRTHIRILAQKKINPQPIIGWKSKGLGKCIYEELRKNFKITYLYEIRLDQFEVVENRGE